MPGASLHCKGRDSSCHRHVTQHHKHHNIDDKYYSAEQFLNDERELIEEPSVESEEPKPLRRQRLANRRMQMGFETLQSSLANSNTGCLELPTGEGAEHVANQDAALHGLLGPSTSCTLSTASEEQACQKSQRAGNNQEQFGPEESGDQRAKIPLHNAKPTSKLNTAKILVDKEAERGQKGRYEQQRGVQGAGQLRKRNRGTV